MLPYGIKKRKAKSHPHNECSVCCAYPPDKGSARQDQKKILEEELKKIGE